jgi:hypothetical protein
MKARHGRTVHAITIYKWLGLVAAIAGIVFMLVVFINGIDRFGLTWSFEPKFNSDIGTFVASVAGTLFALTNALLLYATLKTQLRSQEHAELQHLQIVRESNYNRIYGKLQALENTILQHSVRDGDQSSLMAHALPPLKGYDAWQATFEHWRNVCFPTNIVALLERGGNVAPDRFLEDQAYVNDTFLLIASLRQDLKLDLEQEAREYLTSRLDAMVKRLAISRRVLESARRSLSKVVEQGVKGRPKQVYVSDLLHVIAQVDRVLELLPETPYKSLSPFESKTLSFDSRNQTVMLECDSELSFQINEVHFDTRDERWAYRFNHMYLRVRIEAFSTEGASINAVEQIFGFGQLTINTPGVSTFFETNGEWWIEGMHNMNLHRAVEHARWVLTACLEHTPLGKTRTTDTLLEGEHLKLVVKTNGIESN